MFDDLRIGVRVRVTGRYGEIAYHPGEKGTVLDGPNTSSISGAVYYVVVMDKDAAGRPRVFLADEIEAEVEARKGPT